MKNELIREFSDGLYIFDLEAFMNKQQEIEKKYKLHEDNLFNGIDKFLSQINEEISEVLTAPTQKETIEEFVDVLMYIGSAISYIAGDDISRYCSTYLLVREEKLGITTRDSAKDAFIKVSRIRRLFPERKWHKSHEDERENIYKELNIT